MPRTTQLIAAGALVLMAGCASDRRFVNAVKNKPAPDFELADLSGAPVKLSSFRGQPVLLAFWAHG